MSYHPWNTEGLIYNHPDRSSIVPSRELNNDVGVLHRYEGYEQYMQICGMGGIGRDSHSMDLNKSVAGNVGLLNLQEYRARKMSLGMQNSKEINKKEIKKMGFIKEYFNKHKELFMGIALAVILDRYLLGGAFQERLKRIITSFLDKAETTLNSDKPKV